MELKKVYEAKEVLKEVIRETDVIYSPKLSKKGNVYLKTENLQVTGSFKIRGSYYKISCLKDEEKEILKNEVYCKIVEETKKQINKHEIRG